MRRKTVSRRRAGLVKGSGAITEALADGALPNICSVKTK